MTGETLAPANGGLPLPERLSRIEGNASDCQDRHREGDAAIWKAIHELQDFRTEVRTLASLLKLVIGTSVASIAIGIAGLLR